MKIARLCCVTFVLIFPLWCTCSTAEDLSRVGGAFETGNAGPAGWSLAANAKGLWLEGESHTGARALSAESKHAQAVWVSEPISVCTGKNHIVDGWIKTTSGTAWLEVDLRDATGKAMETRRSQRVSGKRDWTYVAVETPPSADGGKKDAAITAQIAFWVRGGRAALDDVGYHHAEPVEIANAGFEAPLDKKSRVPYWSEETENGLMPPERERAGSLARSSEKAFEETACIAVTASGAWFAVSSVPYSAWPWWDGVELTAMTRCEPGIESRLGVLWQDSAQRFLGAGIGDPVEGDHWQFVSSGRQKPPKDAYAFKPVLVAQKKPGLAAGAGTAWFDNMDARVRQTPYIRVVANQVGYETQGPKSALILTNFLPAKSPFGEVEIINANGKRVFGTRVGSAGRMYGQSEADWGWYFWRAGFSSFREEGQYRVRAKVGPEEGLSYPFRIGQDLLFQETAAINVDFFFVQRCGCEVPGWHAPCHLDDAKLKDGTHRDLVGGWHSAGDYNKLAWEYGDGGVFYALVHAANAAPRYFAPYDRNGDAVPDVLDEARWGAQYLAKIQEPATGGLLNHIEQGPDRKTWMNWCPPERTTDNVVGTADDPIVTEGEGNSPLAIGGWALIGGMPGMQSVSNDYLERSIRLWEHATARVSPPADPLLLLSSVDLYLVTHDERYLAYCRRAVEGILASGDPEGRLAGGYGDTGDVPAAALACFALKLPSEPLSEAIKARLEKHLPAFIAEAANPFGLMMQRPGAGGYYFEPTSALGCNFQICCRAWSALMVYRVTRDPRALEYATDQLDFVLGKNPYGLCMMEGKGTCNLPRYHHRYITIPGHERGAVPGAIPNGFVRDIVGRDRPGVDLSTGGRPYPSYRTNEPWLVHNVFYVLAVTALHEALE